MQKQLITLRIPLVLELFLNITVGLVDGYDLRLGGTRHLLQLVLSFRRLEEKS